MPLAKSYTFVLFDHPGHGKSDHPNMPGWSSAALRPAATPFDQPKNETLGQSRCSTSAARSSAYRDLVVPKVLDFLGTKTPQATG